MGRTQPCCIVNSGPPRPFKGISLRNFYRLSRLQLHGRVKMSHSLPKKKIKRSVHQMQTKNVPGAYNFQGWTMIFITATQYISGTWLRMSLANIFRTWSVKILTKVLVAHILSHLITEAMQTHFCL